jgi:hypothetical protein
MKFFVVGLSLCCACATPRDRDWYADWGYFEPKVRAYFDTGTDDPGEVDVFQDGALTPTVNFASFYAYRKAALRTESGRPSASAGTEASGPEGGEGKRTGDTLNSIRYGFNAGIGISSPAGDSPDGTADSSDAPVVVVSMGVLLDLQMRR